MTDIKRGGQVGYFKPSPGKAAVPIYRESMVSPWRLCEDIEFDLKGVPVGEELEVKADTKIPPVTPGYPELCELMQEYGYRMHYGLIVILPSHEGGRELLNYWADKDA